MLAVHGLKDLGLKLNALTRRRKWSEMAREMPDDVVHLFAAIGRHDQIVAAIERCFGGFVDALTLRGEGVGDVPPDLVQDTRRLRTPSAASCGRTDGAIRTAYSLLFPFVRSD